MSTIVGIDPGWSGGVAQIGGPDPKAKGFTRMTETDIVETLEGYLCFADVCYIEKVHSAPKQGVRSVFKFGHVYGLLRGVILSSRVRVREVSPQKWQRYLGCLTKGDKNVTKSMAQRLFPCLKITHATADALLIAEYGARITEGK